MVGQAGAAAFTHHSAARAGPGAGWRLVNCILLSLPDSQQSPLPSGLQLWVLRISLAPASISSIAVSDGAAGAGSGYLLLKLFPVRTFNTNLPTAVTMNGSSEYCARTDGTKQFTTEPGPQSQHFTDLGFMDFAGKRPPAVKFIL